MGYTRYWETNRIKNGVFPKKFVDGVKDIIETAEKCGISIKGPDGYGEPVLNKRYIGFNGDAENGEDHESLVIAASEPGFGFCKTARKAYDPVVNAVLQFAEKSDIISSVSSDEENMEEEAEKILKKAFSDKGEKKKGERSEVYSRGTSINHQQ